jgi:zinc and cadmium transporter
MPTPIVPLTYYCTLILAASVAGGLLPIWFHLTHRRMEIAVSFVAAMMFGVAMTQLLPHAVAEVQRSASGDPSAIQRVFMAVLGGWLAMFLIERFFCFHHHDVESDTSGDVHQHESCEHHHHDLTWTGAAIGLTLHSVLAGVALAAAVIENFAVTPLAGFATFLVILLHKPFDSMTLGMLMARGGWSMRARHLVNGFFALAIPLGAGAFYIGVSGDGAASPAIGYALAFAAGIFICISLSDLLPELQFHHHDRLKLTIALMLGLAVAYGVGHLESLLHRH